MFCTDDTSRCKAMSWNDQPSDCQRGFFSDIETIRNHLLQTQILLTKLCHGSQRLYVFFFIAIENALINSTLVISYHFPGTSLKRNSLSLHSSVVLAHVETSEI
jgi:hypothetical protein